MMTGALISLAALGLRYARVQTSSATSVNRHPCSLGTCGLDGGVERQRLSATRIALQTTSA